MKTLLYLLALTSILFASSQKADTASCKKCHPLIAKEFELSMHKKSSIYEDKVHKAVWDKHPGKAKGNYKCAKCHTPNAKDEKSKHDGITCLSCHTIMDVEKHSKANKNIYSTKPKTFYSAEAGRETEKVVYKKTSSWFGMNVTTVGSSYHDIDYTNKKFYNGQVCMGCHSHKQNAHEFEVCSTSEAGAINTSSNCITCHMPKIDGSATTVRISKQHAFHGFAGSRVAPQMLSKYVSIDINKDTNSFKLLVNNHAPHNLLTHPLRVVQLRSVLVRDRKKTQLKTHTFVKIIGHEGKPAMPWVATEVLKDNMIKANETRSINFDTKLESGDTIEVELGFYVVNPKVLKKLNLDGNKELEKFTVLKRTHFDIK